MFIWGAPARGYIRKGLDEMGVAYTHHVLDEYGEIYRYYQALDAYLITSREEGGPEAALEAMASGIPLVSTRVGLAPDVLEDENSGLLAASEDVQALSEKMLRLIESRELREKLTQHALLEVQAYDWADIAAQYYYQVYEPIIVGKSIFRGQ